MAEDRIKQLEKCFYTQFENKEYKKEWIEMAPTGVPYKTGNVSENIEKTKFDVCDGANNVIAWIDMKGNITYNGKETDYNRSFAKYAKMAIEAKYKKLG